MARTGGSLAHRLYSGDISFDFIGRRRWWYAASGVVLLVSLVSLLTLGLHLGIEFKGGAVFQAPANKHSLSDAKAAVSRAGATAEVAQRVGEGQVRIQTKALSNEEATRVSTSLATAMGVPVNAVTVNTIGPSWGGQITRKAVVSLGIFLVAVIAYLSIRFEPKMAFAAIIALIHDLVITAGIYSLSRFEVTPATVIALLTILGYSLYDTVVVFDKVRENTQGLAGGSRMTFSQAVNLGVNQTLVRSMNTTIIALLPVAALLIIGAGLLGAGTLKDLALALLIGLASGAYSSIFIAPPLLCDLKEREPQFKALARRVEARQSALAQRPAGTPAEAVGAKGRGVTVAAPRGATAVLDRPEPEPARPRPPRAAAADTPDAPTTVGPPPDVSFDEPAAPAAPAVPPAPRQSPPARSGGGAPRAKRSGSTRAGRPSGKRKR